MVVNSRLVDTKVEETIPEETLSLCRMVLSDCTQVAAGFLRNVDIVVAGEDYLTNP